jgi:ATPase subunit of ABC transporter with duplicated ATPase domains
VPSVHLRGLSYAHTTGTNLFEDADLDLAAGAGAHAGSWVGVVGANGAGKTTLLRLIAGELAPSEGTVEVHAPVPPRLVPQTVDDLTEDVRTFAWTWDGMAEKLRARLELDPDELDDQPGPGWRGLSPGQRKRWQVAAALAEEPEVLLLDEPTNHLDADARDLLVDVLTRFTGLGLLVSHDRTVLDLLTTRTVRLHRRAIRLHPGPYGDASPRWRAAEQAARVRDERARAEARRERRILAEVRRDRHSAEVAPRRERRLAGASQPDAREAGRKLAQRKAEVALGRRVTQSNARVARAEAVVERGAVRREVGGEVGFRHAESGRRILGEVVGDVAHAGGQVWLREADVALHRGERVHLVGANGAGKTTLLGAFERALAGTSEVVASLPQELPDAPVEWGRLRADDPVIRGRILGAVASLGVDPELLLSTDAPSPGEARKLALARLLSSDASVLVLDEPTNHLDIPSIERLQDALTAWPGALLLVTHDDRLAAGVTSTRWTVTDGRVHVHGAPPVDTTASPGS